MKQIQELAEKETRLMDYITRNLEKVVNQVTKEYPVVLVTGPRQVGKTTMLQKLMDGTDRGYVTLDDLNERNLAKTDPELFLQLLNLHKLTANKENSYLNNSLAFPAQY